MGFETVTGRDGGWVLTDLEEDTWEILRDDQQVSNEEGFDTLQAEAICRYGEYVSPEDIHADWQIGSNLTGTGFYVVGVTPKCLGGTIWKASLSCKGLAHEKPAKVRISSNADQQSAEDIAIDGIGLVKKLQTFEAAPSLSVSFVRTSGDPATDQVGLSANGGNLSGITPPGVRDSFWEALEEFLFHYPNGYVLEGVEADQIPGTGIYFETHNWRFIHAISP